FRNFVKDISLLMLPLTDLLRNCKREIKWTEKYELVRQKIFDGIQDNILLHHPDYSKPFELHTDASERGIGAVLLQDGKIIGIFSKKLNDTEQITQ
ncbi:transposable element, partial [Pseudoloma neurophilia]